MLTLISPKLRKILRKFGRVYVKFRVKFGKCAEIYVNHNGNYVKFYVKLYVNFQKYVEFTVNSRKIYVYFQVDRMWTYVLIYVNFVNLR